MIYVQRLSEQQPILFSGLITTEVSELITSLPAGIGRSLVITKTNSKPYSLHHRIWNWIDLTAWVQRETLNFKRET